MTQEAMLAQFPEIPPSHVPGSAQSHMGNLFGADLCTNTTAFAMPSVHTILQAARLPAASLSGGYGYFENAGNTLSILRPFGKATGTFNVNVTGWRPKFVAGMVKYLCPTRLFSLICTLDAGETVPDQTTCFYCDTIVETSYLPNNTLHIAGDQSKSVIFDALGFPVIGVHLDIAATVTHMGCEVSAGI